MAHTILGSIFLLGAAILYAQPGNQGQAPQGETQPAKSAAKKRDLTKFTVEQRLIYLSAQRGMDWLQRTNKVDGRFVHGFLPALRVPLEGDHYLRQAGAAFALARAARFFENEQPAAIARQALLTLLLETGADPKEPHVRASIAHPGLVNPTASAGMLAAAIHELPSPAKDLLDQADQLCNFLRKQLQADGSLRVDAEGGDKPGTSSADAIQQFSGPALYALIKSQHLRPAAWKLEALRKARGHYLAYWKQGKNVPMLSWHSAAYVEAFQLTKERAFADAVFEMNDWLCTLQYKQVDPRRANWMGGFKPWIDGKTAEIAPDITSAAAAESLAEACRAAKLAGDAQRHQRYRQALESCLQFLTTLQYTEGNAQHFADWYRPALVGAFHASHQDGNLRLDYAQHTLSAMVQYLSHVADLPGS